MYRPMPRDAIDQYLFDAAQSNLRICARRDRDFEPNVLGAGADQAHALGSAELNAAQQGLRIHHSCFAAAIRG
jgi:hypothetical protein